ncbi:hypothetical protein [Shewanella pealeana]|uniref:Transmembrane cytochrome oxidase associated protein n=1 Tax=Shewanella pealeana (strain ATCC 700345 / ANG-SQ1) TaxID=398579 RepID=A8H9S7_SHEPA|nr:hypothetical protein [Shewanella pealeana]ABV89314.1 conserved hypothetical protein [Shewanella pealeana ATCC 700345]
MNSPKKNGKKTLMLLILAFALPVMAAKLVLSFNLYNGGATNKGQLLDSVSYTNLAMANPQPQEWQLLYQLPRHCDVICEDRLYILQQSHIALGRNQDRVHTIIMVNQQSDTAALTGFDFVTATPSKQLSQLLNQQEFIIVDPLGSLVMSYPIAEDHQAQIMQGKALVADLRKLLKLSRIG